MKSYDKSNKTQKTSKINDNMHGTIDNQKLFVRNFQNINNKKLNHTKNLDRLFAERDFDKNSNSDNDSIGIGEITGNKLESDILNKGLPMRSQYNHKKEIYDANKYLDFNLFNEKPQKKIKIGYNDETNNYTSYADLNSSMKPMTQQINPIYITNNSMEKFGSKLNFSIAETLNENYIVNTYGLYTLFSSLYLISENITENECKKFFNLSDKNTLLESLQKITTCLNFIGEQANIKNFIVYGNNIPYIQGGFSKINKLCTIASVNIMEPEKEALKLTFIINSLMKTKMRNPVTFANIENLQLMFLTIGNIHPIWTFAFGRIGKGIFFGNQETSQKYLISYGETFSYFEDNERQLVEISCGEGELMFGIILSKKEFIFDTNEKIHFYIENMKETTLDEIRIPIFSQDLKLRYNSILKKMGLNSVFQKITANNVFPEGHVILHDIIQNIKITIDEKTLNKNNNTKGVHSIRKFIADRPFNYYFRLAKINTIFLNGRYC